MINKNKFSIKDTKKVLHKVGKRWVVVSAVLLGLAAGGAAVTTANADVSANHSNIEAVNPSEDNGISQDQVEKAKHAADEVKAYRAKGIANDGLNAVGHHLKSGANVTTAQSGYASLASMASASNVARFSDNAESLGTTSDNASNTWFGEFNSASNFASEINDNNTNSKVSHAFNDINDVLNHQLPSSITLPNSIPLPNIFVQSVASKKANDPALESNMARGYLQNSAGSATSYINNNMLTSSALTPLVDGEISSASIENISASNTNSATVALNSADISLGNITTNPSPITISAGAIGIHNSANTSSNTTIKDIINSGATITFPNISAGVKAPVSVKLDTTVNVGYNGTLTAKLVLGKEIDKKFDKPNPLYSVMGGSKYIDKTIIIPEGTSIPLNINVVTDNSKFESFNNFKPSVSGLDNKNIQSAANIPNTQALSILKSPSESINIKNIQGFSFNPVNIKVTMPTITASVADLVHKEKRINISNPSNVSFTVTPNHYLPISLSSYHIDALAKQGFKTSDLANLLDGKGNVSSTLLNPFVSEISHVINVEAQSALAKHHNEAAPTSNDSKEATSYIDKAADMIHAGDQMLGSSNMSANYNDIVSELATLPSDDESAESNALNSASGYTNNLASEFSGIPSSSYDSNSDKSYVVTHLQRAANAMNSEATSMSNAMNAINTASKNVSTSSDTAKDYSAQLNKDFKSNEIPNYSINGSSATSSEAISAMNKDISAINSDVNVINSAKSVYSNWADPDDGFESSVANSAEGDVATALANAKSLLNMKTPQAQQGTITVKYVSAHDINYVISSKSLSENIGTKFNSNDYTSSIPSGYTFEGTIGNVTEFTNTPQVFKILVNPTTTTATDSVEYVYNNTPVVNAGFSVTGNKGTKLSQSDYAKLSANVPNGYQLANPLSNVYYYNNQPITIKVVKQNNNKPVKPTQATDSVVYKYNNDTIGTGFNVTGNENAKLSQSDYAKLSANVPNGYQLANPLSNVYYYNNQPITIKVVKQNNNKPVKPTQATDSVVYKYNNDTIGTGFNVTGNENAKLSQDDYNELSANVPNGYQLTNPLSNVYYYNNQPITINVKPIPKPQPQPKPNSGNNSSDAAAKSKAASAASASASTARAKASASASVSASNSTKNSIANSKASSAASTSASIASSEASSLASSKAASEAAANANNNNMPFIPSVPTFNNGSMASTNASASAEPNSMSANSNSSSAASKAKVANYVTVEKALQLHTNPNFTKKNGVLVVNAGTRLDLEKTVKAHHGLVRYEVNYKGKSYFITANKKYTTHISYELSKPSHYRYFKVGKTLQLHTSPYFTKKNGVITVKPNTEFRINKVVKAGKYVRYEVSYKGSVYFVTANKAFSANAYLQKSNFGKHGHKAVRVIKKLSEYKKANFHKHSLIRNFRKGSVLPVKRVITIANGELTRLQLTNGRYVTANKDFVKVIK